MMKATMPSARIKAAVMGFTLLEMLVAIGIFSVVAMVSYTTLDTYLDQRERLTVHYGRLERLQRLFILLERDIQFAANRAVRIGGDLKPAIEGSDGDSLVRMTVAQADMNNPTGVALKRVQWRLEGKELIRAQWGILDHEDRLEPSEVLISDEVDDMELSFWFYTPERGVDTRTSLEAGEFPAGIEVAITLDGGVEVRRLFALAKGAG